MAIVAVEVTVVSVSIFRDDEVRRDWSDTARRNLMNSIVKHFGRDPAFAAVREWQPGGSETVQQDLVRARNTIRDIPATTPDKEVRCLSSPAIALTEGAGTDTILLLYAKDRITTTGSLAALIPLAAIALPIMLWLSSFWNSPAVREASRQGARRVGMETVALCLVDSRKGETLWFHTELLNFGNLRDAADVDRLVQRAYSKFTER